MKKRSLAEDSTLLLSLAANGTNPRSSRAADGMPCPCYGYLYGISVTRIAMATAPWTSALLSALCLGWLLIRVQILEGSTWPNIKVQNHQYRRLSWSEIRPAGAAYAEIALLKAT